MGFEGRAIPTLESLKHFKTCALGDIWCASDSHGHGTHCAGTVGGATYGIAKQVTIHAVKVLADSGSGYTSWITKAMDWIITSGESPSVMSMSLGSRGVSHAHKTAADSAVAAGVTVVVAAGNSASDACKFSPAFVPAAITVGSTTISDSMSSFSNHGTCIDIFAPGSNILSAYRSSDTASTVMSGTSMACPHVAGAAAVLLSNAPSMQPGDIVASLVDQASGGVVKKLPGYPASPNKLLFISGGGQSLMPNR